MKSAIASIIAAILTSACGSIEQAGVIHNADLQFRSRHEHEIAKAAVGDLSGGLTFDDRRFVLSGHRVVRGEGDILTFRGQDSGVPWKTDQASFRYLTIYFPKGYFQTETPIRFGSPGGPFAFFSRGSLNMPGTNGCFGYGRQGSISLKKLPDDTIKVILDLKMGLASPLKFQGECGAEEIHRELEVKELGLADFRDRAQ